MAESAEQTANLADETDYNTDTLFGVPFRPKSFHYGEKLHVVPANIEGKALTLLANGVFNSALVFSEWIDRGFLKIVHGCSVLELGAGTGLPSLRLLQDQTISLRQCVVTDYPSDEILQPLRDNFSRLQLIENVEVAGLDWNDIEQIGHIKSFSGSENKETGFDLILAADLLWYTDAHAALSNVICRLLRNPQSCERKKTTPRALLATGKYVKRANLYSFLEMIVKNGLSWRELSVDSPEDAGEWQSKNREWPSVPWKSDTPVWWQDEDGQREYLSVDNLSERKNTVWIFEIRWPQRLASS